ncbi:ECF transporter S component [Qiania dongpingensis]|uniref:ECF transporter S component n=1 Tax=Qiania dongpingensis TaxID=2763669 RepID=A0A7G9G498_9FIRM|nr:ECF transporter S component [Qiania dongpingensis]QNM05630.1 ECF transporter S component [Qiania dongpingensis]
MNTSVKTRNMVLTAVIAAIIILMAFVPYVGYINLVVIKATLIHVPVIIGSVVLGPKKGAFLGFIFGLTSLINNTFNPSLLSFAFSPFYSGGNLWSLLICFVPRILVGVFPYFVFKGIMMLGKGKKSMEYVALPAAGVVGALTNTLLVMNLIYFCFVEQFAAAKEIAVGAVYQVIIGIVIANGVPEAIVALVLTMALGKVLLHFNFSR